MVRCKCGKPAVAEIHLRDATGNGISIAACDVADVKIGDTFGRLTVASIGPVTEAAFPQTAAEWQGIRPEMARGMR